MLQRRAPDRELVARDDVLWIAVDMVDPSSFPTTMDRVVDALGEIDILVNNAGMMSERDVDSVTVEEWNRVMAASKAALHGMTRAMAVDLGKDGIRVNTIAPGWIVSELSEKYLDDRPHGEGLAFMTGQTVVVDGGRTAKLPTL